MTETTTITGATNPYSVATNFNTAWTGAAASGGLPLFGATTMVAPFAYGVPPAPAFNPVFNFGNVTTGHYNPTMGHNYGPRPTFHRAALAAFDDNDDTDDGQKPPAVPTGSTVCTYYSCFFIISDTNV